MDRKKIDATYGEMGLASEDTLVDPFGWGEWPRVVLVAPLGHPAPVEPGAEDRAGMVGYGARQKERKV